MLYTICTICYIMTVDDVCESMEDISSELEQRLSTGTTGIRGAKGKRYTRGGGRLATIDTSKAINLEGEKVKAATTPRSVTPISVQGMVTRESQKSSAFVKTREVVVRER